MCRSVVTVYHRTKFGGRQSLVRILAASPMQRAWSCSILAVFFIRTTSNYYLPTYLLVLILNDSPRLPSAICHLLSYQSCTTLLFLVVAA